MQGGRWGYRAAAREIVALGERSLSIPEPSPSWSDRFHEADAGRPDPECDELFGIAQGRIAEEAAVSIDRSMDGLQWRLSAL